MIALQNVHNMRWLRSTLARGCMVITGFSLALMLILLAAVMISYNLVSLRSSA